ncbi:zinc finger protein [Forsythia ovata]|uniref:Zinc finger protein n=1 Tax=Forsythia ovata TaxID=205694 RepID=A0ABD1W6D6_9LAMI
MEMGLVVYKWAENGLICGAKWDVSAGLLGQLWGDHPENPKRKNSKVYCYYCKKIGHLARDYRDRIKDEKAKNDQISVIVENKDPHFVAMVEEANSVGVKEGWCLDTRATIHGKEVKMGNNVRAKVA